jgi:hypothetical protein
VRQEDGDFKVTLGYTARTCVRKPNQAKTLVLLEREMSILYWFAI